MFSGVGRAGLSAASGIPREVDTAAMSPSSSIEASLLAPGVTVTQSTRSLTISRSSPGSLVAVHRLLAVLM